MDIQIKQIKSDEFGSLFSVVKQGLFTHVDSVFGWCDEFQSNRLKMITSRIGFIGFISMTCELACYVSSLTTITSCTFTHCFSEFQNQKIGERVMNRVHEIAHKQRQNLCNLIELCYKNKPAVSFYQSLGYQVTESDESFVSLSLNITS